MAYAPLNLCVDMTEDSVTSLIIEQPAIFYSIISDIDQQINGTAGTVCFSDTDDRFSVSKEAILLTQFIPFETNQKPLLNALYAKLKKASQDKELFFSTHEINSRIDAFIGTLAEQCQDELIWDKPEDITALLKAVSLRFYDGQPDFQSKLLDFMLACREYLGKRLFITVNLRSYLGTRETSALFRSAILQKLTMFCIENREYPRLSQEQRIIIDEDACVI